MNWRQVVRMFFSWFSHHHRAGLPDTVPPYDDRDHSAVVLITFAVFFSFIILYLVAGVVWASAVTACAVALSFVILKVRSRRRAAQTRRRAAAALRVVQSRRGGPADVAVAVPAIPAFEYKREGGGGGGEVDGGGATGWAQCVICLGMVQVGEVVRRLPACKHLFHVECIDVWLRSHSTCPLCRAAVGEPTAGMSEPPV
ncbi:hypothetical protein ACP70R_034657 [Stipagrostis hirtigluma subsp. patula]